MKSDRICALRVHADTAPNLLGAYPFWSDGDLEGRQDRNWECKLRGRRDRVGWIYVPWRPTWATRLGIFSKGNSRVVRATVERPWRRGCAIDMAVSLSLSPLISYSKYQIHLPDPTPRPEMGHCRTLCGGTLSHRGFYDLLAPISTPSPSLSLWGASTVPAPEAMASLRLSVCDTSAQTNFLSNVLPLPTFWPCFAKNGRRISKDMMVTRYSKPNMVCTWH